MMGGIFCFLKGGERLEIDTFMAVSSKALRKALKQRAI